MVQRSKKGESTRCSLLLTTLRLCSYDSHLSPDGQEVVIFDNRQILPCYIVHYTAGAAKVVGNPKLSGALGSAYYDEDGDYD